MLAPVGFTQQLSKEAYVHARMTASAKGGLLRYRVPAVILSAALVLGGVLTFVDNPDSLAYTLTAVVLVLCAAVCLATMLYAVPAKVRSEAAADYETFAVLSDPAEVHFTSDDMTFVGPCLSRRVEFAKTRLCIETPARFVIVTDDEAVMILEKACFTDSAATEAFLRDVFARWYTK